MCAVHILYSLKQPLVGRTEAGGLQELKEVTENYSSLYYKTIHKLNWAQYEYMIG